MRVEEASCLLVAKVLVADGMMTETERALLEALVLQLGLDESERARVIDLEGMDAAEARLRSEPEERRRAVVDRVLEAALADGRLSPHEITAVRGLTEALGLG